MPLPQMPSKLFLMVVITYGSQICAFLSSIHTKEKLNSMEFNHYYQYHNIKSEQAIALIIKKIQNIISITPCHRH